MIVPLEFALILVTVNAWHVVLDMFFSGVSSSLHQNFRSHFA